MTKYPIIRNGDQRRALEFLTVKSVTEALIFASTNPQHDNRLFIELQVQYMKIPSSNLGRTCCVQKLFLTLRTIFAHNMFSPCSAKKELLAKIYLYLCTFRNPGHFGTIFKQNRATFHAEMVL